MGWENKEPIFPPLSLNWYKRSDVFYKRRPLIKGHNISLCPYSENTNNRGVPL